MKQFILTMLLTFMSITAMAQISGTVYELGTDEPLPAATVLEKGTTNGTTTNSDGIFSIDVEEGETLVVSFVGFLSKEVIAEDGMSIYLEQNDNMLDEVVVSSGVIDIAKVRETPVASTLISPRTISQKIGNQEFPEIMNSTPSVYATKQGGGYGDSRISLRGFSQRNTSFLINGQPVNDMENGWVYWSNWQGLTDVASGIQIQRGLGASRLAVPSVGGTISIFTKAAERQQGGAVSQTVGNDGYVKTSISYNTGKNDRGWASSFLLSRWAGNGYADFTQGEGWTYFAAVGYEPMGSRHSLNLSVLGAGQWHHQRRDWIGIDDYLEEGNGSIDRRMNKNGGYLNGEEFSMRRNFYNKPLATFNWDFEITDRLELNTSLYGSAGRGGGTGPRGDLWSGQFRTAEDGVDFDAIVDANRTNTDPYQGSLGRGAYEGQLINDRRSDILIRRASMNSHNWFGGISNLEYEDNNLRASIGVDLRKYTGYHYRAVNNLMGLDGYFSTGNSNSEGKIVTQTIDASPFNDTGLTGPKINYYDVGYVDWQGLNGLVEYSSDNDKLTAVVQGGLSNQGYQREDFFSNADNPLSGKVNQTGGYVKGGANYNLTETSNVFFNTGVISRQPLYDAVFLGFSNDINPDLQNEQIVSFELGYGYLGRDLDVKINAYSTTWGNRFVTTGFEVDGEDFDAQFDNVSQRHIGVELESNYRVTNSLKLIGMLSVGDWRYIKDFQGQIYNDDRELIEEGTLYTEDVKVGDAAQLTGYVGAEYRVSNFVFDGNYRHVDNLYADYSVEDFTSPDNEGALGLPSFGLVDLGTTINFAFLGQDASFRVNVNNVLDTVYISESESNIHATDGSTTYRGVDVRNNVWFGFGRTWNASLKYNF